MRWCDRAIRARRGTTTCPFAQNVFYGFWLNEVEPGVFADSAGIPAYSAAVGEMVEVTCIGAGTIVCRGGDGAVVTFPRRAIADYTVEDAIRYAVNADLGNVPQPTPPALPEDVPKVTPADPVEPPSSLCHPSYEGACLEVGVGDYDCDGGSGNGPNYTGTVRVVGVDEFGLDRDGDSLGCE